MKKLFVVLTAVTFAFTARAQEEEVKKIDDQSVKVDDQAVKPNDHSLTQQPKEGVKMEKGKMMVIKDGKTTLMEETFTLHNGAKVKTDGTVEFADGKTIKLTDGDYMDMNGKLTPHKKKHPMKSRSKM